jgi:uncharacterized C2H2 Zn-finger protein
MKAYRGDGEPQRTDAHTLDCPECSSWFSGFKDLAEHVKRAHTASRHAPAAQQALDHFALTSEDAEPMRMPAANRQAPAARTSSSTTIPRANREQQNTDYNAFLKAEFIGKVGKQATLTLTGNARSVESQFGEQIIVEVKHRGNVYDWGIKLNSPNHRLLEDFVGTETTRWRGKKIDVTVRENLGRDYIAIDKPNTPPSHGRKVAKRKKR